MSTARTDCDSHVLEVRESELVTVLGGVRSSGCCTTVRECQTKCVSRGCSEIGNSQEDPRFRSPKSC